MLRDYQEEKKILNKLEELKETKNELSQFNKTKKGLEGMMQDYYENADLNDDLYHSLEKLKKIGLTDKEILELGEVFIEQTKPYMVQPSAFEKGLKKSCSQIEQDIGEIMMEQARTQNITQRQLIFPNYGKVSVSSKTVAQIENEEDVVQSLAQDKNLRKYLKIDKQGLNKIKTDELLSLKGFKEEEKLTVTIRGTK